MNWKKSALIGLLFSGYTAASGLQVTPVTLTLEQTQRAEGIWLSNSGDSPINAQVRVFRWSQSSYKDQLAASQGLVISPPMLTIPPGGKQLIRVIRTGSPAKVEDAYRLSINELPQSAAKKITCSLSCIIPSPSLFNRRASPTPMPNCSGKFSTVMAAPGSR